MESIKEIYKIGRGPSSSHTMGPAKAAHLFLEKAPDAASYKVYLYGSLAATGKGHLTDVAVVDVFGGDQVEVVWEPKVFLPKHPNAMRFEAFDDNGHVFCSWTAFSIGGGAVVDENTKNETEHVYPHSTMNDVMAYCEENGMQFWEYVKEFEGDEIWDYLAEVWKVMQRSIKEGLEEEGVLPGGLKLARKASVYLARAKSYSGVVKQNSILFAYALAVSEQNAAGGVVVTAPTCGASGVIPAILKFYKKVNAYSEKRLLKALATAGIIGALVKTNASISGAEVGCQGEVGTACAMASGAVTQLLGGGIYQVEYAAEMGLEHHLGLTCDPVKGLVQIPCIERNAFAAARVQNHASFALMSDGKHRISFDQVVKTMMKTGLDLNPNYKETSEGGLALC